MKPRLNREEKRARLRAIRKKSDKELEQYLNFLANKFYRMGCTHVMDAVDIEIGIGPVRRARIEQAWERQLEYDGFMDTQLEYEELEKKHEALTKIVGVEQMNAPLGAIKSTESA